MSKTGVSEALQKRMGASNPLEDSIDRDYNAMFGLGQDCDAEKVVELCIDKLRPHPLDPFKPYSDERLKELAESIASVGLLDPINVRPCSYGSFEILTGKNRANAVRLNGSRKIKAIIRDVDDDTVVIMVTDSNLKHREKLLSSEKAWAYKMQLDAIRKQGKHDITGDDDTSTQIGWKSESANIIAEQYNVCKNDIRRHIRLTLLINELLDLLDSGKIPFMAGVDLSYISGQAQREVYEFYFNPERESRLNLKSSEVIKRAFSDGKPITKENLPLILSKKKRSQAVKPFSIHRSRIKDFADKVPNDKELEKLFIEFLKERFGDN